MQRDLDWERRKALREARQAYRKWLMTLFRLLLLYLGGIAAVGVWYLGTSVELFEGVVLLTVSIWVVYWIVICIALWDILDENSYNHSPKFTLFVLGQYDRRYDPPL